MNTLFIINEIYTNGYKSEILDIISIFAILSSIFVIISKNAIISLLFLIGLFACISSYLLITGLSFLGLAYLVVYIGAVSILFLFILMLINIRMSELQSYTNNSIPLAISIGILFNYPISQLLPYDIAILNNLNNYLNYFIYNTFFYKIKDILSNTLNTNINDVLFVTSKSWDGYLAEVSQISAIGNTFYTNYNIWLFLTALILLLAMVGCIVVVMKTSEKPVQLSLFR